jgi:hypothetical protein
MNITRAIIKIDDTIVTRIDSECLAECEDAESGAMIDRHRQILEQAFSEIHEAEAEVLFPELEEIQ